MAMLGKTSEFVNGLRVTDAETRDIAIMVLAGKMNTDLVTAIGAQGQAAMGMCGGDGHAFRARKKIHAGSDLGFVGEICASDPKWIHAIWGLRCCACDSPASPQVATVSITTSMPTRWRRRARWLAKPTH